MNKDTSISLGIYFEQFIQSQISAGLYNDISEVIRSGLRLLENEESKVLALNNAIEEGLKSPRLANFNFDDHLETLKAEKRKIGFKKQINQIKKTIYNMSGVQAGSSA